MGLVNLLIRWAGVAAGAQIGARIAHRVRPRPYPAPLRDLLDHPVRMRYRDPVATLGPFGLGPGETVLDLGCGTGTFTVEMARQVGGEGRVHAVDIQASMVEAARARVESAGFASRVDFHHCGAYRLPLERHSVDVAVAIGALSEMPQPLSALEELRRVLKPSGRLAVSEEMPHIGYVPQQTVRRWLGEVGFRYGGMQGTPFCYSLLYFNDE